MGDIRFQWKYGFYFLYLLMIVIYMVIFSFFNGEVKNTIVSICVYSDPAAMGMFFMGAIVLLEKSQRIINSIAISPVTTEEYILGKLVSFGCISELVGLILMSQGHTENPLFCIVGILFGSILFTLCGIIVGTKVGSLNQYIIGTIPFEIVGFVPVIAYRIGFMKDNLLMLLHPGCAAMQLIDGNRTNAGLSVISCLAWCVLLFIIADGCVKKMFLRTGGTKL